MSEELNLAAWLLFLLVFIWQMPHFYAISLFRKDEYAAAGVPVLGVVKPFKTVRRAIGIYIFAYLITAALMIQFGAFQLATGILVVCGGIAWISVFFFSNDENHSKWAKSIFGTSLLLTLILLTACCINVFLVWA